MTIRECIIIGFLCACIGLLLGLRQQHKQKDYMIKMLIDQPVQVSNSNSVPNLPKIEELK